MRHHGCTAHIECRRAAAGIREDHHFASKRMVGDGAVQKLPCRNVGGQTYVRESDTNFCRIIQRENMRAEHRAMAC